ncbi:MAG: hypothetical protein KGO82_03230 [Bacteroidota bacterium]|nr:hypothetical protein [Bacteroidota bacterium]
MNLGEQWKDLNGGDADLAALIGKGVPSRPSIDPIERIKRNLRLNAIFGIVIALAYVVLMFRFPVWQVLVSIGIVFLFTVWAVTRALIMYRDMRHHNLNNSLLEEMERHYTAITGWDSMQQKLGMFVYPVAAAGGFMVGGALGSGKPIDIVMSKPIMVYSMIIMAAILVPVGLKVAKWMSRKAFGQYADQLKANIDALKSAE